ncbi:MAG TPA: restriction endonuclease [Candidatus Limnocylindria bacterium]|nr:restriction endonuclease [Candidatus Limnocylindria bacterium]
MRITDEITLFDGLSESAQLMVADRDLVDVRRATETICWPPGSETFVINPTREGNGVVPIRKAFALGLRNLGWDLEVGPFGSGGPGPFDGARPNSVGWSTFVEWETGNISSSHRSLNRLVLALMRRIARQGVLVLADAGLYPFLTDRVGNWRELSIYRDVYDRDDVPGRLVVVAVSFDATDPLVPLIGKGTDGRALR